MYTYVREKNLCCAVLETKDGKKKQHRAPTNKREEEKFSVLHDDLYYYHYFNTIQRFPCLYIDVVQQLCRRVFYILHASYNMYKTKEKLLDSWLIWPVFFFRCLTLLLYDVSLMRSWILNSMTSSRLLGEVFPFFICCVGHCLRFYHHEKIMGNRSSAYLRSDIKVVWEKKKFVNLGIFDWYVYKLLIDILYPIKRFHILLD